MENNQIIVADRFASSHHAIMIKMLTALQAISRGAIFERKLPQRSGMRIGPGVRLKVLPNGSFNIGRYVSVGTRCGITVGGTLVIGDNTYLNPRSRINAMNQVIIGSGCAISWDVDIIDDDFHSIVIDGQVKVKSLPILISDRVWIGMGAKILKGSEIGADCVVAAGSVVSGRFPPNSLIAGVPAKVVRQIDGWLP